MGTNAWKSHKGSAMPSAVTAGTVEARSRNVSDELVLQSHPSHPELLLTRCPHMLSPETRWLSVLRGGTTSS